MRIRKWFLLVFCAFAILLIAGFLFRNRILQWKFNHIREQVKEMYHADLNATKLSFTGVNRIRLSELALIPENTDTLVRVNEIELQIVLLDFLKGKISFDQLRLNGAYITFYNQKERNNLDFLKQDSKQLQNSSSVSIAAKKTFRLRDKLSGALNMAFEMKNMRFCYRDSSVVENIYFPKLKYDLRQISGLMINEEMKDTFSFNGNLQKNNGYRFALRQLNEEKHDLPFSQLGRGLKYRFQSVSGEVKFEKSEKELLIVANVRSENFQIQHQRLSKNEVIFPHTEFKGTLRITDDALEMDSSSILILNHAKFQLFAHFHRQPEKVFAFSIHMTETVSDTFFHALPQGMFNTLKSISCSGTLTYDLQFFINTRQPDSLIFNSSLRRKDFHIIHYGKEDFSRINEPFIYNAYDKDRFVREIVIGPENHWFTSLRRISPHLIKSVLQAEDPSFMIHRGFLPESFRESIIQNYKEDRFARGGSTISMQLVKNVFLSRDKTISRKAEEALIVYLIENLGLVSKERMLEVYLNVIEWGPNVYGIGEAAHFYFDKTPMELKLHESIFLSALIPKPKVFQYHFDKSGEIKPYLADYFKLLITRMTARGVLSDVDTAGLVPYVKLKGPALRYLQNNNNPIENDGLNETE